MIRRLLCFIGFHHDTPYFQKLFDFGPITYSWICTRCRRERWYER